jgi:hypothetical protein
MSKQRSRYDELHDEYYQILSTKSGTRYERLAAVVFKHLEQSGTVIHDLKLQGDSQVKHQIDVIIESNGIKERTILECKDFDISGNKVGLGIVRDFYGVIADVNPDKAYIVTCNGFTPDAELYSASKNIGLIIIREFSESDWDGRVKEINITLTAVIPSQPRVDIQFEHDEDWQKIQEDLQSIGMNANGFDLNTPAFFNTPNGRIQAYEFIQQQMKHSVNMSPDKIENNVDVSNVTLEIASLGSVVVKHLKISYENFHSEEIIKIGGDRIAKLLVEGIGSDKKVIWDDDLLKLKIDEVD